MLDDTKFITGKDPDGALAVAAGQWEQTRFEAKLTGALPIGVPANIVVSGMGGSALAALMARVAYGIPLPFEVSRGYAAPAYVSRDTLFIASSYSGNTEETVSALKEAHARGARIAVIASGGKLIKYARDNGLPYVTLPTGFQPRMAVLYNLRALTTVFTVAGLIGDEKRAAVEAAGDLVREESKWWGAETPTEHNYAKQLALHAVGKTPVIYGGALTAPVAYKWKISFNENAKNVAFWNEYPEFNHNEFIGWTSHPIEKPFAIFDLVSPLEHPQIQKRFELSDRLLSGKRPKSKVVTLKGDTLITQMVWGCIFADFVTIYTAILNGVNPVPVPLIEKLKTQL